MTRKAKARPAAAPGAVTLSATSIFFAVGTTYGAVSANAGQGPTTGTVQAAYGGDTKSAVLTVN